MSKKLQAAYAAYEANPTEENRKAIWEIKLKSNKYPIDSIKFITK